MLPPRRQPGRDRRLQHRLEGLPRRSARPTSGAASASGPTPRRRPTTLHGPGRQDAGQGHQGRGRAEHGHARRAAAGRARGRAASATRSPSCASPSPAPCGKTPLTARAGCRKSYGSLEVFTDVDLAIDRGSPGRRPRPQRRRQDHAAADPGRRRRARHRRGRARARAASSATTPRSTRRSTSTRTVLENMRSAAPELDRHRGAQRCSARSCSPATTSTSRPGCSPAARRPGWRWPCWSSPAPTCCCSTSRPTTSTRPPARRCSARCAPTQGAIVLVTHDEGAVAALEPERVLLLPDGVEDLWSRRLRRPGRAGLSPVRELGLRGRRCATASPALATDCARHRGRRAAGVPRERMTLDRRRASADGRPAPRRARQPDGGGRPGAAAAGDRCAPARRTVARRRSSSLVAAAAAGTSFSAGLRPAGMLDAARASAGRAVACWGCCAASGEDEPLRTPRSPASSAASPWLVAGAGRRPSPPCRGTRSAPASSSRWPATCGWSPTTRGSPCGRPSLGLVPDLAGTAPLVRAVGYARALEICATGRAVGADEARAASAWPRSSCPGRELDAAVGRPGRRAPGRAAGGGAARPSRCCERAAGATPAEQRRAERAAQARLLPALAAVLQAVR